MRKVSRRFGKCNNYESYWPFSCSNHVRIHVLNYCFLEHDGTNFINHVQLIFSFIEFSSGCLKRNKGIENCSYKMTNITQHIISLISFFNADQIFFHIYPGELNQAEVIFNAISGEDELKKVSRHNG